MQKFVNMSVESKLVNGVGATGVVAGVGVDVELERPIIVVCHSLSHSSFSYFSNNYQMYDFVDNNGYTDGILDQHLSLHHHGHCLYLTTTVTIVMFAIKK